MITIKEFNDNFRAPLLVMSEAMLSYADFEEYRNFEIVRYDNSSFHQEIFYRRINKLTDKEILLFILKTFILPITTTGFKYNKVIFKKGAKEGRNYMINNQSYYIEKE